MEKWTWLYRLLTVVRCISENRKKCYTDFSARSYCVFSAVQTCRYNIGVGITERIRKSVYLQQAGQVASHIAKTACWAHPNPCKMRKCSFAAAHSSCAWHERYLHIKKATLHSNLQFFNSFESISSKSFLAYSARGEIPISAHVAPWSVTAQ